MKQAIRDLIDGVMSALKQSPQVIKDGTVESVQAIDSPDQPTRRMAWLFILSLIGAGVTLGFVGKYFYARHQVKKAREAAIALAEKERKEQEAELLRRNRPPTYQSLGGFSLELKEKPGVVKARNAMGSAEMEIVVACDEPEVCAYIQANLDAARGELSPLFVPADRDTLLTIAGKKALREEIRLHLNRWLLKRNVQNGLVIDVLLPKFIVS